LLKVFLCKKKEIYFFVMSFSRLPYDTCAYVHELKESIKPGDYMLKTPLSDNKGCFFPDPSIRLNTYGASLCDKNIIDVDSELLGLNVKNTKCPSKKFTPSAEPFCNKIDMKDCSFLSSEDTRLSNPPCTLRGTGWNRWEWLCENPQTKALIPFETDINYRMVAKDNHRPCVPTLSDQTLSLPTQNNSQVVEDWNIYKDTSFPNVHWRCCGEIAKY